MKKAQNNLDSILNRTRKPRTQEAGHPYFSVVVQKSAPVPIVIETSPVVETGDWYPLILLVVTVVLIVGLIVGNKLGWA